MRSLTNFIRHLKISKILPLMNCFWPKYKTFELKDVQKSYVSWHWILMQNLKENWLVLSTSLAKWLGFVYELSGCGFEFRCSHLNFRYRACFQQGVPWHSGKYGASIHSETLTWHDKNIQSVTLDHVQKYENLDFCWVLLSKVENLWAPNLQGSYMSWQWRIIQNLKRTWLFSSKLTWGI